MLDYLYLEGRVVQAWWGLFARNLEFSEGLLLLIEESFCDYYREIEPLVQCIQPQ